MPRTSTLKIEDQEHLVLRAVDAIVSKWAKKMGKDSEIIEGSIAYLWEDRKRKRQEEWRDYLSANDIGPYGGR